ncbi:MAG: class I SAM-dependent methyltransferase [Candidatus Sericytochromatia bacterium]
MTAPLSLDTLSGVSETLLIPLFGRVWEYEEAHPLLSDAGAHALGQRLLPLLEASGSRFHQAIVHRRWPDSLQVLMALRTRHFDAVTRAFLDRHADAQVVMLGCGLDGRYERLGCPPVDWLNIDLPDVIALRRQLFDVHPGLRELAISALDPAWLDQIDRTRPTLVLAEGLLMYLTPDQIRGLFCLLADSLRGEFLAEVVAQWAVSALSQIVLRQALQLKTGAAFAGGLHSAREPESWHPALKHLGNWGYLDAQEPRLGLMNLGAWTPFRHLQWVVHYALSGDLGRERGEP